MGVREHNCNLHFNLGTWAPIQKRKIFFGVYWLEIEVYYVICLISWKWFFRPKNRTSFTENNFSFCCESCKEGDQENIKVKLFAVPTIYNMWGFWEGAQVPICSLRYDHKWKMKNSSSSFSKNVKVIKLPLRFMTNPSKSNLKRFLMLDRHYSSKLDFVTFPIILPPSYANSITMWKPLSRE